MNAIEPHTDGSLIEGAAPGPCQMASCGCFVAPYESMERLEEVIGELLHEAELAEDVAGLPGMLDATKSAAYANALRVAASKVRWATRILLCLVPVDESGE
jgi:hypothetical protein